MRDNKENLEQRLADILSEYADSLNKGIAPSIEEFLSKYEPFAQDLKPIMEVATFVKEKTRIQVMPEWKKEQAFEKVHARLLAQAERKEMREGIERGTGTLPLNQRPDFLILLLHSMKEIWGITKVVKLLFLMGKEAHFDTYVPDYYNHYAYTYGPFEGAVYKDIEALKQHKLIEGEKPPRRGYESDEGMDEGLYPEKVNAIYRLTDRGEKVAKALIKSAQEKDPSILQKIEKIRSKYGYLPLKKLLKYIYTQYPEYAKNSEIKKEILEMDEDDN